MSSKTDSPSFDDLDEVEISEDSDGGAWIDLEPGETVTGEITAFNPRASYNGVAEIDGVPMRLNATMRKAIISGLVEGATIGIRKSEDSETFENDDGEETEYYPRDVRVQRDN